ncbi:LysE family translocator [Natrialba swarupiae]|uniref:LysE family translocator n=1 Tax=Natrialba swarupiae TaxID=2448032 RepID=A0A5D5AHI0_9EURY|nr:LysE family translocator [Natrialba swarupiae]TYT60584.1 LysE family translocator [Natrialba swarupiae]
MIDPTLLAFYLLAAGAMILSPGPDTIYVLTRSFGEGSAVGVASAAGISAGVVLHTLGAVVGLAALFRASSTAFLAVTYLGAAYLVYLGVRTIRDDALAVEPVDRADTEATATASRSSHPFTEAVTVNVLNPQVALFFLAFLPQFVDGRWIELQLSILGGLYAVLTMLYLGSVALVAGRFRRLLVSRPNVAGGIRWASGLALIALGLRLFLF